MRKLGSITAGLFVGAALAAATAATAAAAPPEFGRCVEVAPKTGEYGDARGCVKPAPGRGKYDFQAGPGEHKKFTGSGGPIVLETTKKVMISCQASSFSGEYTGAKTETASIKLTGCFDEASATTCQTVPVDTGEVEGPGLEGEIGFITGGAKPTVGLDLKRSPDLFTFECGGVKETFSLVTVEGSVIAVIKPLDHTTEAFRLFYKAKAGKQIPEQFEGGLKDTLTASFTTGLEKVSEAAVLNAKKPVVITNEEAIEIKVK